MKRDYAIFLVAMTILTGGLSHALHTMGLPWWGIAPLALGAIAFFARTAYRQSQKELRMAEAEEA
jgi:4-amino-4-deoxy-L-arabinose transferase-like glycosyltransferase